MEDPFWKSGHNTVAYRFSINWNLEGVGECKLTLRLFDFCNLKA